jgi:bacillithiol biosynthesis cysteine-adding enzyme BshC
VQDEGIRQGLADRVRFLYSSLDQPKVDPFQLEKMGHINSRFVVTAHQPIILGGPLYVLYKLSSVVVLAKQLNKHPKRGKLHFIPLFWVGDEDHDLDEVGHCHVLGKKISWNPNKGGATGRMLIENPEEFLSPLESVLGNRPEAARWMQQARECYRHGITLLEATVRWSDALFGAGGLVVFSGDDARLKSMAMPLWEEEIYKRFSEQAANEGGGKLLELGYHAQISPRAVNLFWLEQGSRARLLRHGSGSWQAGEKIWADDQAMMHNIKDEPEKISPNVVLRPVYQEYLLQSAAFVGGPAEIAYWLQLYLVFQRTGVNFPPVLLRATMMLMDDVMSKRWQQFALGDGLLFQKKEDWVRAFLEKQSDCGMTGQEALQTIRNAYLRLAGEAGATDPGLKTFVLAELSKAEKSIGSIAQRILKARKQKSEVSINRLHLLHERLFPDGQLQERYDNFLGWVASDPKNQLLDYCLNHLDYPTHELLLLRLSNESDHKG